MGVALLPPPLPVRAAPHETTTSHTIPKTECTCGARAFEDERQRKLARRIAPMGAASVMLLHAAEQESSPTDKHDDETPTRKRSLWRKILGKGPKCICDQLAKEREAARPRVLQLPSEYDGCTSVRVAGKRVAYTREMQRLKRFAYTPMDTIHEEDYDA